MSAETWLESLAVMYFVTTVSRRPCPSERSANDVRADARTAAGPRSLKSRIVVCSASSTVLLRPKQAIMTV
jgi:hypothetical protein